MGSIEFSEPFFGNDQDLPDQSRRAIDAFEAFRSAGAQSYRGELGLAGANPAYATELSQLVEALQFDSAYVEEIAAFGKVS